MYCFELDYFISQTIYIQKRLKQELINFEGAKHYIYDYCSIDKYIHKINGYSDLFHKNGKYLMASWKFKSFELLIGFQDLYLYFYDL